MARRKGSENIAPIDTIDPTLMNTEFLWCRSQKKIDTMIDTYRHHRVRVTKSRGGVGGN